MAAKKGRSKEFRPSDFAKAFNYHMTKHGDTPWSLANSLSSDDSVNVRRKLRNWTGGMFPRSRSSLALIHRIELKYRLSEGYFAKILVLAHPSYRRTNCALGPFHRELNFQMRKHADTGQSLARAVYRPGDPNKERVINQWKIGRRTPNSKNAYAYLERIEDHYRLPLGYFAALLAFNMTHEQRIRRQFNQAERKALSWHLPRDFDERPKDDQEEIVAWIKANIVGCHTEYGRRHSLMTQYGFAVVFPKLRESLGGRVPKGRYRSRQRARDLAGGYGTIEAPARLSTEMQALVSHKTDLLPKLGFRRHLRWSFRTAQVSVRHLGILLGALAAAKESPVAGLGVPPEKLSLALLVYPSVWDWFLRWRERKRGFFSATETISLYLGKTLLRKHTGWIRQYPRLANNLRPIRGLVSQADINLARENWGAACDAGFDYVMDRLPEMLRARRRHRDPFEPIVPILNADEPLKEYKKIADEVRKDIPRKLSNDVQAAIAMRSYILIRLLMHLGIRQRNARELLVCAKSQKPHSANQLEVMERGELRWNDVARSWEVYIPAVAFKNGKSSYFRGRPYRTLLPNIDGFYGLLERYISHYRPILVGKFPDSNTLFVKTGVSATRCGAFDSITFYTAWKTIIRRYGIYNPYTKRGAIKGLLPHGPHCIRDVIATHVLKKTGSYELAGFAIQDTAESVANHYARFLPHEKAEQAAKLLDRVWRGRRR